MLLVSHYQILFRAWIMSIVVLYQEHSHLSDIHAIQVVFCIHTVWTIFFTHITLQTHFLHYIVFESCVAYTLFALHCAQDVLLTVILLQILILDIYTDDILAGGKTIFLLNQLEFIMCKMLKTRYFLLMLTSGYGKAYSFLTVTPTSSDEGVVYTCEVDIPGAEPYFTKILSVAFCK